MPSRKGMYSVLYRVYSDRYLTVRCVRQRCPERDLYSFQGRGPWGEGVSLRDLPYGQAFFYCALVDEYAMVLDAWTDTRGRWNIICSHYCPDCGERVRAVLCSLASPPKTHPASADDPSSAAGQPPGTAFQAIDASGQPMSTLWWNPHRPTRHSPSADGGDLADRATTDHATNASSPWPEAELLADCYALMTAGAPKAGVPAAGVQKLVPHHENDPQRWRNRDSSWIATRWIGRATIFLWATLATPSRLGWAAESPETTSDDHPPPSQHWPVARWGSFTAAMVAAGCGSSDRKMPAALRVPQRAPLAARHPTAIGFSSAASRDLYPSGRLLRQPPGWPSSKRAPFPALALLRTQHAAHYGRSPSRPRRQTRGH